MTTVWAVLAGVVVLVGVVGTVLPGLPGAVLVLAGFVWLAWLDEFTHIGRGTIVLLTALTIASYAVDLAATALGAQRAGASRWAVTGAFAGTLVGLFFGLPGLLLGPFVGAVAGEYLSRRTLREATRAGLGAWIGIVVGTAVKLALVCTMVGIGVTSFLIN